MHEHQVKQVRRRRARTVGLLGRRRAAAVDAPERALDLVPFTRPDRELQVPAGVVATGPPAQCDLVAGQPEVLGVVVDRLQGVDLR
jgi:hypothetical protein